VAGYHYLIMITFGTITSDIIIGDAIVAKINMAAPLVRRLIDRHFDSSESSFD
jgi:hypothetical protein